MKLTWPPVRLLQVALLIATSAVGAYLKIPSPTGTVALDSLPGYFAAAALGIPEGMTVGAAGHLFSAWSVGFPLGGLHLGIALEMAAYVAVFGFLFRSSRPLAVLAAILLNGVAGPLSVAPFLGWAAVPGLVLALLPGSAINVGMAAVIALRWRGRRKP
ncbi:MAG: ECF transporter S component [Armatimonadota bacterium]|nr:ECF transporter S component [Armatimonadota bacterium]MDR5702765.1 ECF transporter S component [Armatimonadota bacterium]MDR7433602.1 ECF transporter S component [Armatimonadota bacterium]